MTSLLLIGEFIRYSNEIITIIDKNRISEEPSNNIDMRPHLYSSSYISKRKS